MEVVCDELIVDSTAAMKLKLLIWIAVNTAIIFLTKPHFKYMVLLNIFFF